MGRTYRVAQPGFKFCNRCNQQLPATPGIFLRDKSRHDGLAYECRACHSERKKGRDRRKERWSNMTPEQRAKRRAIMGRYNQTLKGRAVFLRKAYQRIDACDLSTAEVAELIKQPCTYCGTTEENRGLDRVDNDKPHVKGNVVPCCAPCNFARGDRFSMEEMSRIGAVIRDIFRDRACVAIANEVRL